MLSRQGLKIVLAAVLLVCAMAPRAAAQGAANGTVFGTVKDAQGGVIPGATVTLISDTQATKSAPVVTNASGDFVFPNVPADTYTVQIEMPSFKTLKQSGLFVSAGARVAAGTLTISVGGASETVEVKGEAPIIQAASGERSFTVETATIDNIPFVNGQRNYATLAGFAPGVDGTARQGSQGQNTYTMDGVLTMDTGSNGQLLQMNPESIAEVKVLTSNYQAEYGRSTGLNIATVSKSGSNQIHGSLYDIYRNNSWNWQSGRSWADVQNNSVLVANGQNPAAAPVVSKQHDRGFSIGGPIGKPGKQNKLFYFFSDEFRPRTSGGSLSQFRVPTDAERAGDFSQSRDNNGNLINAIYDVQSGLPKSQCSQTPGGPTAACFADGGVLGKIPANRLYGIGMNILNLYPVHSNVTQTAGLSYNYQFLTPVVASLTSQPAFRLDYQVSDKLRLMGKGQFQIGNSDVIPGSLPGFNDTQNHVPYIYAWAITANYQLSPTAFLEGTYGFSQNQLGAPGVTPYYNKNNDGLGAIPTLYPNSGAFDPSYYEVGILNKYGAPFFQNGTSLLPPTFAWGSQLNGPSTLPNLGYPSFLNINRTQDVVLSLTKIAGRHTLKAGFYSQHSYKAENINTGQAPSTQGDINFARDTQNPLDTGNGYANAALGIFDTFAQQNILVEGIFVHNTYEGYLQDNWKVNPRLTLDYGLRLTHMQPQYDALLHASNFFIDKWSAAAAPSLYVPGCIGASPCTGNNRNALNPVTGQIVTVAGGNSAAIIGTLVPNSGNITNGIIQAGHGIADEATVWPKVGYAPRFGMAYDVTGKQNIVIRGGAGLFIDRPSLNSFESTAGDPPASFNSTVRYGTLQSLNTGITTQSAPIMSIIQYNSPLSKSVQWNGGVQFALPWQSVVDVSLVGQHAFNVYSGLSSGAGTGVDLNAPDIGAAFLAKNQDSTQAPSAVKGATALSGDLLRPLRGLGPIFMNEANRWNDSELISTSLTHRFAHGFSAQLNYTYGIRYIGTTGSADGSNAIEHRLVHNADGTYSTSPDQQAYEDLMGSNLGLKKHLIKGNFVWSLPMMKSGDSMGAKVAAAIANDWQLSGVLSAGSGARYTPTFSYNSNGSPLNLTGSPSYPARIVITGDPGAGCADNRYSQFNVQAFAGPAVGSTGMESGQNYLGGCADHTVDLAIQRTFRLGGNRRFMIRLDVFNAFDAVVYNARQAQLQLNSPSDLTIRNPQYVVNASDTTLAPGATGTVLNSGNGTVGSTGRLLTTSAGFGAVTGAQAMRSLQLNARFSF
jgi:hypothetical protein